MSKRRYFSGPSVERALLQAARHYEVEPDAIKYEKVEKAAGLNKRRGIVVKVDPDDYLLSEEERAAAPAAEESSAEESAPVEAKAEESSEEAPEESTPQEEPASEDAAAADDDSSAEEPVRETPDAAAEESAEGEQPAAEVAAAAADGKDEVQNEGQDDADDSSTDEGSAGRVAVSAAPTGELRSLPTPLSVTQSREQAEGEEADAARAGLEKLFTLAGLELQSVVAEGDEGRLEIDLAGPDSEVVVEEDGEVLLALQHLLPRVMQSTLGRVVQCRLDCEGFHAVREEKLRDLALQTAGEVSGEGRPRTLHPMHPADRRIVHLALAEDPGVVTESVGSGYFKRVKVRSA